MIQNGVFEVKSTAGNSLLGGDTFDECIIDYIADEFQKEHGVDLRNDNMALQRIKEAAEKAKIELSSTTQTEINLPYIIPINNVPKHLVLTITRAKFEQLIDSNLNKLRDLCSLALKESGYTKDEIDEVILVGGSTRIPSVQKVAEDFFNKTANKSINPDEAVAIGASVQGDVLS